MSTALAALVAESLKSERFTFVDIGCSGGIDPAWRVFAERLRAVGFDASAEECERLTRQEDHPDITYVSGFVGWPADHPFADRVAGKLVNVRNPYVRTSSARMALLQQQKVEASSHREKLGVNAWQLTRLADATETVIVPTVLEQLGWSDVDLIKIDIDGPDFGVLSSLGDKFDSLGVLAAQLEINLYGGAGDHENVFHNTDRLMRERGFELLGLDIRSYSMAALPAPFAITWPAQTVSGRPYQGEAYYARDPAGSDWADLAGAMRTEKLAKLAAIFSVWNLPDAAAEILLSFRDRLAALIDVDRGLDLLAAQAQPGETNPLGYKDYIKSFEAGAERFYPKPDSLPPLTWRYRLAALLQALKDPHSAQPKPRHATQKSRTDRS